VTTLLPPGFFVTCVEHEGAPLLCCGNVRSRCEFHVIDTNDAAGVSRVWLTLCGHAWAKHWANTAELELAEGSG
jgi:hypothetical protein